MNIEEIREAILVARGNKMVAHFKGVLPLVPSWAQFIEHLDHEFNTPPAVAENDEWHTIYNGVVNKQGFYFHVRDVTSNGSYKFFPEVQEMVKIFNEVYNEKENGGGTFINIVGNGMNVPLHEDDIDSVFWQCQGNTTWEIFLNKEDKNPMQTINVNPGDVVVVPVGVLHRLSPNVARAAIAFRYNRNGKE